MERPTQLVWLRNDLRIDDNPALYEASQHGPVEVLYIHNPGQWQSHNLSSGRLALTGHALRGLAWRLAKRGIPLHCLLADSFDKLPKVLARFLDGNKTIGGIHWNNEYGLDEQKRDQAVEALCRSMQLPTNNYHASVLIPPSAIRTGNGQAYKVFTPFRKAWLKTFHHFDTQPLPPPEPQGKEIPFTEPDPGPLADAIAQTNVAGWPQHEQDASKQLDAFLLHSIHHYADHRDIPAVDGTSRLSPALTIGMLSPRQCLQRARWYNEGLIAEGQPGITTWINELLWREFYLHVLADRPDICKGNAYRRGTESIPWRRDTQEFEAWCQGETGFPLVDAAMRQLNETGWMHNRLRMLTAMFLSKYLLIDWRMGESWFMQKLTDGHFASNNGGWQWAASTGTDAVPYFRLLSPVRQAQRFDPDAHFIKTWLPHLNDVPAKIIHQPGHPELLAHGHPPPIVDLREARQRCLSAFSENTQRQAIA